MGRGARGVGPCPSRRAATQELPPCSSRTSSTVQLSLQRRSRIASWMSRLHVCFTPCPLSAISRCAKSTASWGEKTPGEGEWEMGVVFGCGMGQVHKEQIAGVPAAALMLQTRQARAAAFQSPWRTPEAVAGEDQESVAPRDLEALHVGHSAHALRRRWRGGQGPSPQRCGFLWACRMEFAATIPGTMHAGPLAPPPLLLPSS